MSSHGIHTSPLRRLAGALAAIVLSLAATVLVTAPASAHDELVATDPAAGSSVAALPAEIALTFSGLLSTESGATEISVTDASGPSLVDGEPTVSDTVVTQRLTGAASGDITVLWKVVSSDGHPISGEFSFAVEGSPTPTPTSTSPASTTPSASPSPTQPVDTPSDTATPTAPPAQDASAAVWPWVVGGIIVLAVAGALIYLWTSRARRERSLTEDRSGGTPTPPGDGTEPPLDR
ncbi:copper resistance CopC family protein [Microbacterium sp. BK668]|uniref:copper resistance CopC family protein n=1 Tax=Microbacterium sp. BK668 TaxID=2512118 RepID=UPI00105F557E|nr:copper resistance CopC family protein [Microbacterium sp. BK668]TDN93213.1 hypothetical protein EV279_2756 [Microbacterium sp. BK668]